jgi:hypothetical protein
MQQLFQNSIANDRFNLNTVYQDIFIQYFSNREPFQTLKSTLEELVGLNDSKKIIKGLIRYAFYIEPVKKPKIETTKFAIRWAEELIGDPRYASYDSCSLIFTNLFQNLINELASLDNRQLIKLMVNNSNVSYEIPIDYINNNSNPIHQNSNISWCWGVLPMTVVKLRNYLTDSTKHEYSSFFRGVYNKIKTKTYLTDRVLTGTHKTNREKRWECHPDSVHFALRKVAWEIELNLMIQVCHFDGFPQELKELLSSENVLIFEDKIVKCPITFEPLSFQLFKDEIENTTHGKSDFQVGHMNPLKADAGDNAIGHSSENISWISEQGNRIQGSNSVEFIRELIIKIYKNYRASGIPDAD